jgi:hypothetical protein
MSYKQRICPIFLLIPLQYQVSSQENYGHGTRPIEPVTKGDQKDG